MGSVENTKEVRESGKCREYKGGQREWEHLGQCGGMGRVEEVRKVRTSGMEWKRNEVERKNK